MSDLNFSSPVEIDIDLGDKSGQGTIKWGIEIEAREYGVKSLILVVPDQTIATEFEHEDDNGDKTTERQLLKIENIKVDCPSEFGPIWPSRLAKWRGTWTLEFA